MKTTLELLNLLTAKYPPGDHEGNPRHHAIMITDGKLSIQLILGNQFQSLLLDDIDLTKDAQALFDEIVSVLN